MRLVGNLHAELLLGLFLRGAGALSSFVLVWVIARAFGPATIGLFQIGLATANLLSVVAAQGLDRLIVRVASVALAEGRSGVAASAFRQSVKRQLIVAGLLALVLLIAAEPFADLALDEPRAAPFIQLLAPAMVSLTIIRLCASMLRSKGRILLSQSLDGVTYTTIAALLVGGVWLAGAADWPLLPPLAYLVGTSLILLVALWQTYSMIGGWGSGTVRLQVRDGLYIAAFNGLSRANEWIGLILLTSIAGAAISGIYRVAFQVTLLFQLVNFSFAVMVGPRIAAAAARGDSAAVKQTVRTAGGLGTLICLPLFMPITIWPEPILELFGPEFGMGADALRILAVGHLINVAFGPVGAALTMMKEERSVFAVELFATVLSIGVTIIALPAYGMVAVAAGSTAGSLIRNAACYVVLRRHLIRLGLGELDSPAR